MEHHHPDPSAATPAAAAPSAPEWSQVVGIFDLETTGLDVTRDRIVTAHVGVLDAAGTVLLAWDWLADPGVEIPDAAAAVHGLNTAIARTRGRAAGPVIAEIVRTLRAVFAAGIPVVAYNAPYDFSLLHHEAVRYGVEPLADPSPVIDPFVVDKAYDRWRRGKRTLQEVAAHYAVQLAEAHEASADAVAAGRVAQALAARFASWLPPTAAELHTKQIAWARTQAASLTDYFIQIGRLDPQDPVDGSWPVRSSVD